jgi:hypothetical protein
MERIGIYPKDLQILTGKSERHCRKIISRIRETHNKLPHQLVTFQECFEYLGLPLEASLVILKIRK